MESIANIIRKIAKDDVPTHPEASLKTQLNKAKDNQKYKNIISGDNSWKFINDLQADLGKILPNLALVEAKYDNERPNKRKTWILVGGFSNPKDKKRAVWVHITASGAGSTEDPLDKYDITTQIEILAPKNVKDHKAQEILRNIGVLE